MLLNSKLHIDRSEADVNMTSLLLNNTSYSPKQKSTIVLFYIKKDNLVKTYVNLLT